MQDELEQRSIEQETQFQFDIESSSLVSELKQELDMLLRDNQHYKYQCNQQKQDLCSQKENFDIKERKLIRENLILKKFIKIECRSP